MKILMITSETVPFAKTGGLADAVSALALNLSKQGHDVRIVMPRFYKIDRTKLKPIDIPVAVAAGQVETWVKFYRSELPNSNVLYYELENDAWCCVRPSGTEPKIKFYLGVKAYSIENAEKELEKMKKDILNK